MTFQDVLTFCPANQTVFSALKTDLKKIIPFVGAGLSVPAGYPQWKDILMQIAAQVSNPDTRRKIEAKIEASEYIEAADQIESTIGGKAIAQTLESIINPSLLDNKDLSRSAAYLLPVLFPNEPALTTNFDRVLEKVYSEQGHAFSDIILPDRSELVAGTTQSNLHTLVKLHGEVSIGIVEWSKIVFTGRQYAKCYKNNTPLVKTLKGFCKSHLLLFLGCSLKKDRTVDLLKKIAEPGTKHYAILPCKQEELDQRRKELGDDLNIFPIFYQEGKHEAVRIILEQLLLEHDPEQYRQLTYYCGKPKEVKSPFVYDAEVIDFYGRETQLKQLEDFCGDARPFIWWAITGPGGSGKSRLAYEFCKKKEKEKWAVQYLRSSEYKQLSSRLAFPRDTLIVADYVQGCMEEIGSWMKSLLESKALGTGRVRVLLLERDGSSLENSSWGRRLSSLYGGFHETVEDVCYQPEFLTLSLLSKSSLQAIMNAYSMYKGHSSLSSDVQEQLYTALEEIDEGLLRPLFALFLTDSYMEDSSQDPRKWNRTNILDRLYAKERRFFHQKIAENLEHLHQEPYEEAVCRSFDVLWAAVTITDSITQDALKERYPDLWEKFRMSLPEGMREDAANFLEGIGAGRWEQDEFVLSPLKPDLLGEYYVWKTLKEKSLCSRIAPLKVLMTDFNSPEVLFFCNRLILDYPDVMIDLSWYRDALLKVQPESRLTAYALAIIFVNIIGLCPSLGSDFIFKIEEFFQKFNSPEFAPEYARGLVNLSYAQPAEQAEETIEKLRELAFSPQFQKDPEFTLAYAQGLVNLSNAQTAEQAEETIEKLESLALSSQYQKDPQIALEYTQGLVNLIRHQSEEQAAMTMEKLERLALSSQFQKDPQMALVYAKGLVNLIVHQPADRAEKTMEKLEKLALSPQFQKDPQIALNYAGGLVNLIVHQSAKQAVKTMKKLESLALSSQYQKDPQMALVYAKGLVNLIGHQSAKQAAKTMEKLESLALSPQFQKDPQIALVYAQGLVNLIAQQPAGRAEKTMEKLESLALSPQFQKDPQIALEYAGGLANLIGHQSAKQAVKAVKTMKKLESLALSSQYQKDPQMALVYAQGLVNLSRYQTGEQAAETIEKLESLALSPQFQKDPQIALEYAKGLVNLSCDQTEEQATKTIRKLENVALSPQFQKDPQFALAYAKGLVNLILEQLDEQQIDHAAKTMEKLESLALSLQFQDDPEMALMYAQGLVNLILEQQIDQTAKTMEKLESLALSLQFQNNPEIAWVYAVGLYNLSLNQPLDKAKATIQKLSALSVRFPEVQKIKSLYNKALSELKARS